MANKFSVAVIISAVDKVTAPVKQISENIQKSMSPVNRLQASVKDLWKTGGGEKVTGAFKNFGSAAGNVKKEFSDLLGKVLLFGGAAGVALGAIVKSTYEAGDAVETLSQKTGIGTSALQEFQFAAERSDVPVDNFNTGLLAMSKALGQAHAGTGKLSTLLQKVNPSFLQQLKGTKSNEQAFLMLVDAMQKLKDPQRQAALAAAAFGKSGQDFVLFAKDGTKGIEELRAKARELGLVMDTDAVQAAARFDDAMKNLHGALTGVRNAIGAALLPVFQEYIDKVTAWVSQNQESIKAFAKAFAAFIGEMIPKVIEFAKALFGFFMKFDEATGTFTARTGNIKLAMLAMIAVVTGPLIAALASLSVAFVQLGIAIGLTPVGWILAGLAAIVAAGILLWAYWDDIKNFFVELWDDPTAKIWEFAKVLGNAFIWAGKLILDIFGFVLKSIMMIIIGIGKGIEFLVGSILRLVGAVPGLSKLGITGKGLQADAFKFPSLGPSMTAPGQAATALTSQQNSTPQQAKVTVDFLNLPRGTKTRTENSDGLNLDLGLQFGPMTSMN